MHHGRLSGIIIDRRGDGPAAAVQFWSCALGRPPRQDVDPASDRYEPLGPAPTNP